MSFQTAAIPSNTERKSIKAIVPVTVASATTTSSAAIDTTGFAFLTAVVLTGAMTDSAATVAWSITECLTSGGSYTAISGASVAAAVNTTNGSKIWKIQVDLRNPSRLLPFIKVNAVTADGSTYSVPIAAYVELEGSPLPANSAPLSQGTGVTLVAIV